MQSRIVKRVIPGSKPKSYQFFRIYKSEAYKDVNDNTPLEIVPTDTNPPYNEIGPRDRTTFKNIKNGIINGEFTLEDIPTDHKYNTGEILNLIKGGKKSRKNRKRKTKLKKRRRRTARKRTY